jgi:hypothetical protein
MVGIPLGGSEGLVPHQLLNCVRINPGLGQPRGEGVPQIKDGVLRLKPNARFSRILPRKGEELGTISCLERIELWPLQKDLFPGE